MPIGSFLRGLLADPPSDDGMGQSMLTDLVWIRRFRSLRRRVVDWQAPREADRVAWRGHPDLSRFGDFMVGIADIDRWRCWVVDRDWHGWPDPPEFAFFALERDGAVWAAADFNRWPASWRRPEACHDA